MRDNAAQRAGLLMCGHGSRDVDAIAEFEHMTRALRARLTEYEVDHAYLEFARPVIRDGLEALKRRGVARILALPGMLFAAGHVKNDIPSELNDFAVENPDIPVHYGRDLAIDPNLLRASSDRIEAALGVDDTVERSDTLLVVIGRGTSDPDANSNIAKVARMLWEGMGFGWSEIGFSGVAFPRVTQTLERAVRLGFRRIVVFPYFLFTGVLVKRIYAETDAVAAHHPEIQFIKANYLNDHPLVLDSFAERLAEIDRGDNLMNCRLCKYRTQVIGFEQEAGAPQAGHHHHVRGVGTDADHHHDHDHHHHHHGNGGHHHHD
jgi:sirohydrochlorin cobaltochelatase